jgi:alginate O-acetyltransferase complex protein AlgF
MVLQQHLYWLMISTLLFFCLNAQANEDALYGPTAPAGSAFIRMVNLSAHDLSEISAGNEKFRSVDAFSGTAYKFMSPGNIMINTTGLNKTVQLSGDRYYSFVIMDEGKTTLIEDLGKTDPRKALISLYNLSALPLISLKTSDGKISVIDNTGPASRQDRAINPVKLSLAIFTPSSESKPLPAIVLEKSQVFSLFISGSGAQLVTLWIKQ